MDELRAALEEAFQAAGIELPANPAAMDPASLGDLIDDRVLRSKCKAALVKYRRAVGDAEPAEAPAEPAAAPAAEPSPEPVAAEPAEAEPAEAEPEPESEPEPAAEPMPMSADLQVLYDDVKAAFEAAGVELPADPVGFDLKSLDEQLEDKQLRAKCKSSLVKFRRKANEEGWQALTARAAEPAAKPAASAAEPTVEATAAPAESDGVPAIPTGDPDELYLLTADGWRKLGTAKRQPSPTDELVSAAGGSDRILSVLILDGQFDVPEDIYNTSCYFVHEGTIYRAYYISHVGDTKRGTKTASLKVNQIYTPAEFAAEYRQLGGKLRPSAVDRRRARFGERYRNPADMFVGQPARMM